MKNQTPFFFIFTVLFSWCIWIPLVLAGVDVKRWPWIVVTMLGGVSPSLFGIVFIIRERLYTGKELLDSCFRFRNIGGRNSFFMVSVVLFPFIGALLLDAALFKNPVGFQGISGIFQSIPAFVLFLVITIYSGPFTEEFGWRGYAVKKLLGHWSILKTGLTVGIIWSLWHLPLFFFQGNYNIDNYPVFILNRLLKEVSLSIIICFFFSRTNFSILSAMLLHGLSNAFVNLFLPVPITRNIIHTALLIAAAILVLQNDHRKGKGEGINLEGGAL